MSRTGYTHSEVFSRLKNIKEEVTENYNTYQWLFVLDYFVESAIDPIVTAYPALSDAYFAKVVAWQTHRPSIKFSRGDKFKLPIHLFNALTTDNEVKREHQRALMLNRGLLFGLIALFDRATVKYMQLHDPTRKMNRSQRQLQIQLANERSGSPYLYAAVLQSRAFATKAYWFKSLIVQKYTRLAIMSAKRTYEETEFKCNLNDTIQIYMMYLSKAIDRCDARQGVLTTFIQTWFYSAKAEVLKSVVSESKTSSYDELLESGLDFGSVEADSKYEVVQHLCVEAKRLDPDGALRFASGIPEIFTPEDRKILTVVAARHAVAKLNQKRSP